jgi:hypothetical protein
MRAKNILETCRDLRQLFIPIKSCDLIAFRKGGIIVNLFGLSPEGQEDRGFKQFARIGRKRKPYSSSETGLLYTLLLEVSGRLFATFPAKN